MLLIGDADGVTNIPLVSRMVGLRIMPIIFVMVCHLMHLVGSRYRSHVAFYPLCSVIEVA